MAIIPWLIFCFSYWISRVLVSSEISGKECANIRFIGRVCSLLSSYSLCLLVTMKNTVQLSSDLAFQSELLPGWWGGVFAAYEDRSRRVNGSQKLYLKQSPPGQQSNNRCGYICLLFKLVQWEKKKMLLTHVLGWGIGFLRVSASKYTSLVLYIRNIMKPWETLVCQGFYSKIQNCIIWHVYRTQSVLKR